VSETRVPRHARTIRMDAVRVDDAELEVTGTGASTVSCMRARSNDIARLRALSARRPT